MTPRSIILGTVALGVVGGDEVEEDDQGEDGHAHQVGEYGELSVSNHSGPGTSLHSNSSNGKSCAMSDDRFVSQTELDEQKKKRQEEWEKVRSADQPLEAPDEEYDPRPLYDRLKEVRDKKQAEFEEDHKFKNMVRGLDTEEVGFLSMVDDIKAAELRKKKDEEKELLNEVQEAKAKAMLEEQEAHLNAIGAGPSTSTRSKAATAGKQNKQAQLLSGAIKRKSTAAVSEVGDQSEEKKARPDGQSASNGAVLVVGEPTAYVDVGLRPTAMTCLGVLPGLADYDASSGSSSTDSSDSENDDATLNTAFPANQQAATAAPAAAERSVRRQSSQTSQASNNSQSNQ
uniref:FAM192A/Fyv6 N-terminal domain-containing protein n=1 Tax=Plectus sambesii TaxID=2011161 RepID=A0A914W245_9BILA